MTAHSISISAPNRERRTELLARADATALTALAEQAMAAGRVPTVITAPETGMVMLQVREPVCRERFHLGEVLVTRAEVAFGTHRGWAMRLGDDRLAALAAAMCDALVEAGAPEATAVVDLCRITETELAEADASAWAELARTEVRFEELD